MNAERVFQAEHDDEAESLRLWAWFAIKQAGGKVVVPYDNFFTCQGDATLYWNIDPATLTLTIATESEE
jgi:hypothetical protein